MTNSEMSLIAAVTRADLSPRPYTRDVAALLCNANDLLARRGYLHRAGVGRAWVYAQCRKYARDLDAALDAALVPPLKRAAPCCTGGAA